VAFAITMAFCISFVPHFIVSFFNTAAQGNLGRTLRGAEHVAYNIFLRFPYLNAVANPFIYGALNTAFRAQCVWMWRRITCRGTTPEPDLSSTGPSTLSTKVIE
jgi:hypothetical protein